MKAEWSWQNRPHSALGDAETSAVLYYCYYINWVALGLLSTVRILATSTFIPRMIRRGWALKLLDVSAATDLAIAEIGPRPAHWRYDFGPPSLD